MSFLHERLLARINRIDRLMPRHAAVAPLRAVVELHEPCTFLRRPLDTPICETCSTDDDLHDVAWPCPTITTIARELGVEIGETR